MYLDGSVVEVMVNNRLAHTSRVYDLDAKSATLTILDPGHAVSDAELWPMRSISPDRLTT
jgi:hypothetical protein